MLSSTTAWGSIHTRRSPSVRSLYIESQSSFSSKPTMRVLPKSARRPLWTRALPWICQPPMIRSQTPLTSDAQRLPWPNGSSNTQFNLNAWVTSPSPPDWRTFLRSTRKE